MFENLVTKREFFFGILGIFTVLQEHRPKAIKRGLTQIDGKGVPENTELGVRFEFLVLGAVKVNCSEFHKCQVSGWGCCSGTATITNHQSQSTPS
jgi:hypothetical protein